MSSPTLTEETTVEKKAMSQEEQEEQEELEFEKAAAAAEAQRGPPKPAMVARGRSAPVPHLSADNTSSSSRARSPARARSPVRAESSSAELEKMAAALRSGRSRSPARPGLASRPGLTRGGSVRGLGGPGRPGLTRGGSVRTLGGPRPGLTRGGSVRGLGRADSCKNLAEAADLQDLASGLVQARHSTGGRSRSPKRGPRRIKSGGDLHEPAHRSLSPNRSCLSSLSPKSAKAKKSMRRQVSFGSKCYEEIPKTLEEEKNDIWYDKSELKDLRKKVKKLAKKGKELDNETESEDCYRGLEPYVKQYQKQKNDDAEPDEKEKCNQVLLELTELQLSPVPQSDPEKRKSQELKRMAQEFLEKFAEQSTKTAAEDEAEARAIYLESMDAEQVSKCFQQQRASARGA